MNKERMAVEESFYNEVAALLNTTHEYKLFTAHRKRRWFNRSPGNGRIISRGLVRLFGERTVHVSLRNPRCNKWFETKEDALNFLASLTTLPPDEFGD